jgi:hypothetical protein
MSENDHWSCVITATENAEYWAWYFSSVTTRYKDNAHTSHTWNLSKNERKKEKEEGSKKGEKERTKGKERKREERKEGKKERREGGKDDEKKEKKILQI